MRKASLARVGIRLFSIAAVAVMALMVAARSSVLLGAFADSSHSQPMLDRDASFAQELPSGIGQQARLTPMSAIPEKIGAAEKMFVDGLNKNFGTVPHGEQLSQSFPITNTLDVPITITYLQPSCGCLKASAAKRALQPGERSEIVVSMDTRRFTGQEFQNVRVKIAGPDFESTCKLEVSAISQTDVVIKPGRVSFGSIERGAAPSQTIDIEYLGQLDWKVEEVVVAKELPFTTVLNERRRQPGQVCYQLKVTTHADAPLGAINNFIYLKTNDPSEQFVPVPVSVKIRAKPVSEVVQK